jgi:hydroxymethylpyrimidine/phosphomethylpyrimidine kinase
VPEALAEIEPPALLDAGDPRLFRSRLSVVPHRRVPTALSIAGSDSGGGAGIQADLKAFARCGVHGMTAITAITAQNTRAVERVEMVSPQMVFSQILAIAEDIEADAVKIGMLGSAANIDAIAVGLTYLGVAGAPVVIDPVMVAESGAVLLDQETKQALIDVLLPFATVVTPNIPEARELTELGEKATQEELARAVHDLGPNVHNLGPKAVVVTGGHSEELVDLFFDGERLVEIPGPRHPDGAAHGSGCTHSSALAAYLARGAEPLEAARRAREIASEAVRDGLRELGSGPGPVNVFGTAFSTQIRD